MDQDSPGQGDSPLNLSAVSKQSEDKAEPAGAGGELTAVSSGQSLTSPRVSGLRVLGRELLQSPEKEGFRSREAAENISVFNSAGFGMANFMFPFSGEIWSAVVWL